MELRKTYRFEASHVLPKHPGKCARLHGHSWVLHVFVKGAVHPETGFVLDFAVISDKVKAIIERLDHRHLGCGTVQLPHAQFILEPFSFPQEWYPETPWYPKDIYPTSENLLIFLGRELQKRNLFWSKLAIEETCTSYAELTREEFDARYAQNEG